ncbi:unnamed protein product [Danaus chrysippus]|uniref:(African queen) hypothetical protein n=1 Tax=Danaus chrysippus TaxID=151541 RepID=A0A8J2QZ50_9NEOP|nr:unnamed protein product [Danaus chrysippus]
MSAKNTKIFEDENTDSGFLSGPLSEQLDQDSSDDLVKLDSKPDVSECDKVASDQSELESGIDLCCGLDNVTISDPQAVPEGTLIVVDTDNRQEISARDIPLLFQQDEDGDEQLHIAAVHGCEKSVGTLIRICPDKSWLDVPNDYGHTALHLAAMAGHAVVARMLVRAGASLYCRDVTGETALHKAVAGNHLECLQALLAPVPEQPPRKLSALLNQKNYKGQMCVHVAAAKGHLEAIQTLVYFGADINAREGLAGWTALHMAAHRGDGRLVRHLMEKCPGVAPYVTDYAGRTPGRVAATSVRGMFDDRDDSDSDEYDSDSDSESLFAKIRQSASAIDVA